MPAAGLAFFMASDWLGMGTVSKTHSSKAILLLAAVLSIAAIVSNANAQNVGTAQAAESALEQGMSNPQGEEIVSPAEGFSAVVVITDEQLDMLVRQGALRVNVPLNLSNSIRSVVIQRPVYFKDKRATSYPDASMIGKQVLIDISDSLLERIDYQPVELKFYESGVGSIVLRYKGLAPGRKDISNVGDPSKDSPIVFVKLKSGKGIEGRIKGMTKLNIASQFGPLKLNFSNASKIEVGDGGKLVVQMLNGDLISGTVSGSSIELLNLWENETIEFSDIEAIMPGRLKRNSATGKTINPEDGLSPRYGTQGGSVFPQGSTNSTTPIYNGTTAPSGAR